MIDMSLVTIAGLARSGAGGQDTGKEVNRHRPQVVFEEGVVPEPVGTKAEFTVITVWEGQKLARILPHDDGFHYFPAGMKVLVSVRPGYLATYQGVAEKREYGVSWQNLQRRHFELEEEVVEAVTRNEKFPFNAVILTDGDNDPEFWHAFKPGETVQIVEPLNTSDGMRRYKAIGRHMQTLRESDFQRS